jgi:hypothetical protein
MLKVPLKIPRFHYFSVIYYDDDTLLVLQDHLNKLVFFVSPITRRQVTWN